MLSAKLATKSAASWVARVPNLLRSKMKAADSSERSSYKRLSAALKSCKDPKHPKHLCPICRADELQKFLDTVEKDALKLGEQAVWTIWEMSLETKGNHPQKVFGAEFVRRMALFHKRLRKLREDGRWDEVAGSIHCVHVHRRKNGYVGFVVSNLIALRRVDDEGIDLIKEKWTSEADDALYPTWTSANFVEELGKKSPNAKTVRAMLVHAFEGPELTKYGTLLLDPAKYRKRKFGTFGGIRS